MNEGAACMTRARVLVEAFSLEACGAERHGDGDSGQRVQGEGSRGMNAVHTRKDEPSDDDTCAVEVGECFVPDSSARS